MTPPETPAREQLEALPIWTAVPGPHRSEPQPHLENRFEAPPKLRSIMTKHLRLRLFWTACILSAVVVVGEPQSLFLHDREGP